MQLLMRLGNKKICGAATVIVAIVACTVFYLSRSRKNSSRAAGHQKTAVAQLTAPRPGILESDLDTPGDNEELGFISRETYAVDKFDRYLERENRSAKALFAVYLLTEDEGVFDELGAKYSTSTEAARARLLSAADHTAKFNAALAYAQVNPQSPLAHLLSAGYANALGMPKEQRYELARKAIGMQPDALINADEQLELRKALLTSGESSITAREQCLATCRQTGSDIDQATKHGLHQFVHMAREASQQKNWDEVVSIANNSLPLMLVAERLKFGEPTDVIVSLGLQVAMLSLVPEDTDCGPDGESAAEVVEKLQNRIALIRNHISVPFTYFQSLDPADRSQYIDILETSGQVAADSWLAATQ